MFRTLALATVSTVAISALAINPAQAVSLYDADNIQNLKTQGDSFSAQLAREYQEYSLYERDQMVDWPDAEYFADKAIMSAHGDLVAAEEPQKWDIGDEAMMRELVQARGQLYQAFDAGARTVAPAEAAFAQSRYDCWVEQAEEGWQDDHIAACREGFYDAFNKLVSAMQPATPNQEAVVSPVGKSIVFFDFDSAELEEEALAIIDSAAMKIKETADPEVTIVGHADRSGPVTYNQGLSMDRAESVVEALEARGITQQTVKSMTVRASGESDNLVDTPDGVREPANRRVEIDIEGAVPALVSALPE